MPDRSDGLSGQTHATQDVDSVAASEVSGPSASRAVFAAFEVTGLGPTLASDDVFIKQPTPATPQAEGSLGSRTAPSRADLLTNPLASGDPRGALIGGYMIVRKLGEGGMGQVFVAYDENLDRKIALKLLRGENRSSTAVERLVREARGLAKLSHPNVVQVYGSGRYGEASVFIAMEYVEGQTLRTWLASEPDRPWREVLATLVQTGKGLGAAHACQLVHRDFKPDNVMVARDGQAKVLDFGLVRTVEGGPPRARDARDARDAGGLASLELGPGTAPDSAFAFARSEIPQLTRTGAIMGTPAYMSLEQLEGRPADALSDQFAFCIVAFEALFGQRPFAGDTAAAAAARMYAGEIRPRPEKSPVPRAVYDALARGLAADPKARWPDMASLLAELEGQLETRRRGLLWLALGASAALVAGVVVATPLVRDALAERDETIAAQEQDLDARAQELEVAAAELARRNLELQRNFDIQSGLTAMLLADSPGRASEALRLAIEVHGRYTLAGQVAPLQIEAGLFAATRRLHDARELPADPERIVDFAFSPDGRRLVTASGDDTAKLFDTATGELLRSFAGHVDDLRSVVFAPDGDRLLTTSADATATLWLVETGKVLATIDDYDVRVARFAPDGASVVVGAEDGSVSVWGAALGEAVAERGLLTRADGAVEALSFAPGAERLALATRAGAVELWDLNSGDSGDPGRQLARFDAAARPRTLAFSHDGSRLAAALPDGSIGLWEGTRGGALAPPLATLAAGHGEVTALAFSPTRAQLLTTGREGAPKLWNTETGALVATIEGHSEAARDLAFAPDGRSFATVGYDSRLRLGDAATGRVLETLEGQLGTLDLVRFSPDGEQIACLGSDRVLRLWQAQRSAEALLTRGPERELGAVAFAPDGQSVLMGERGGRASAWSLTKSGRRLAQFDHADATVYAAAFSPDGQRVATGDTTRVARIWDADSGVALHTLGPHRSDVNAVAFSPDGQLLASADMRGHVHLWEVETGAPVRDWQASNTGVSALTFSPDGSRLASAAVLGLVEVWAAQTGERSAMIPVEGLLYALAFSPDGERLAVAGARKQIEIWSLAGPGPTRVAEIIGEDPNIDGLAFSPDGRRLVSGGDTWVRLWDVETGLQLARVAAHQDRVLRAVFSPDGLAVLSASADGQVRRSVATAAERLELACRALRGNRGYAEVSTTCAQILAGPER